MVYGRENHRFAICHDHKHKLALFHVDVRLYHEWWLVTHFSGHFVPDHISPNLLRLYVSTKRYNLPKYNRFNHCNAHLLNL